MITYTKMNILFMLVVVAPIGAADGQLTPGTPSCAQKLVPCAQFLSTTDKPPSSCCDPLRDAVTNDLKCLCNLYSTPGFLRSLGINVTQALQVPHRCNISGDLSACKAVSSSSPLSVPSPPGSGNSTSHGVSLLSAWNGMSIMVLLWASMLYY